MRKLKLRLCPELGEAAEGYQWGWFYGFEARQNMYQEVKDMGSRLRIRKC